MWTRTPSIYSAQNKCVAYKLIMSWWREMPDHVPLFGDSCWRNNYWGMISTAELMRQIGRGNRLLSQKKNYPNNWVHHRVCIRYKSPHGRHNCSWIMQWNPSQTSSVGSDGKGKRVLRSNIVIHCPTKVQICDILISDDKHVHFTVYFTHPPHTHTLTLTHTCTLEVCSHPDIIYNFIQSIWIYSAGILWQITSMIPWHVSCLRGGKCLLSHSIYNDFKSQLFLVLFGNLPNGEIQNRLVYRSSVLVSFIVTWHFYTQM